MHPIYIHITIAAPLHFLRLALSSIFSFFIASSQSAVARDVNYPILVPMDCVYNTELQPLMHSAQVTHICTQPHYHTHYNLDLPHQAFTRTMVGDGIRKMQRVIAVCMAAES